MDLIPDTRIDWLKYRWYFIALSALALVIGLADIVRKGGLRFGIDFSEGTIVYAKFQTPPEIDAIRAALASAQLGSAVIQRYDRPENHQVMIRVERKEGGGTDLDATANLILSTLRERYEANPLVGSSTEIVGPVVGAELRKKALYATLLSLGAMLVYIGIRFQFIYGVAATIAVFHDVIITLGLVSIFDYEMSLNMIAAFLTLVGYSVNDTIVTFDRIRENVRLLRHEPFPELVNRSINQTLSRTILTSGLTFLTVLALFFLGGEVLKGFAFTLVVGIVVGTYSSIFIASPIVVGWMTRGRGSNGSASRGSGPTASAAGAGRKGK
jgi:preprotein translocase subunit SecF